ncbi:NADPH:adrenodoxin oxidoreductase, mitochondrial-like [Paramacrobiotus metropolitanus]|uniref:NADPH:adrenodoxin oxidoreductase, mitochondrial-like n=1 Tax=Paramacrobiotus metropolitanus TaxID=2943436 RepID=UPI002445C2AD|nr:NADPH:adrenodoxin oxidoreductase, mitochondrial-like [Paramacrobiotus metropolitanus]XP_055347221.1 NADPH:adrenodoxin oxidoreductase, mitochondrial-like [Paramacrobiotus metropolitanus]
MRTVPRVAINSTMRTVPFLRSSRFFSTTIYPSKAPRIAVVGSGPAGFYSAQYVLKHINGSCVDMFEKYPVPFGLVRFGVAPDHPEVKNVIHSFSTTAKCPEFRFFGGVTIGSTLTVAELLQQYHAVVLASGASRDRLLDIPGEDGFGVYSARNIVGWYNGLPDDASFQPDFSHSSAVIVGQGNVAVDVARILLTSPDALSKTDITEYALEALRRSRVRNIFLVGRRGPAQVAFTIKEFRELTKLPDVNIILNEVDVALIRNHLKEFPRQRKRLMELMVSCAGNVPSDTGKNCYLKFLASPRKIVRSDDRIEAVNFSVNRLRDPMDISSGVVSTDDVDIIKCGLVIRSIGYEAVPLCGSIPFDSAECIVPNDMGRVDQMPGLYCSGWIKRGPVGVILTTMNDAYETVDTLMEDIQSGRLNLSDKIRDPTQILELLRSRQCDPVSFEEWEKIDREEERIGKLSGKPREKIVSVRAMLGIAKDMKFVENDAAKDTVAI